MEAIALKKNPKIGTLKRKFWYVASAAAYAATGVACNEVAGTTLGLEKRFDVEADVLTRRWVMVAICPPAREIGVNDCVFLAIHGKAKKKIRNAAHPFIFIGILALWSLRIRPQKNRSSRSSLQSFRSELYYHLTKNFSDTL